MRRILFLLVCAGFCPPTSMASDLRDHAENATRTIYLDISRLQPGEMKERVMCSVVAAVKYGVPANIILAVAEIEGGKPGQYVENTNGTYDVGTMQFNTAYLKDLAQYGIAPEDVASSGCYPYELAAWRLRGHILNDAGDIWTRAANYHSRAQGYNSVYRSKLIPAARKWGEWLARRFATRDVLAVNASKNQ
jgi:hypothetical protein